MELTTLQTAAGILVSAGTIGTAAYVKAIKPMRLKMKNKKAELYNMVNSIHKELKFNGGGSIKDVIWQLKETNTKILARIVQLEESQKIALNLQGQAFWLSNEEGLTTYASPTLCKILGHGESDLIGNNWVSWIIPEDRERVFDSWNFSVENGTVFDEQYVIKRSDGKLQKVLSLCFHRVVNNEHSGSIGKVELIGTAYSNN